MKLVLANLSKPIFEQQSRFVRSIHQKQPMKLVASSPANTSLSLFETSCLPVVATVIITIQQPMRQERPDAGQPAGQPASRPTSKRLTGGWFKLSENEI